MSENPLTEKFEQLFTGSDKTFGQWNPSNGKMHTENKDSTTSDFARHLNGDYGIGKVPVMDDGTCMWGAIDIDNHDGAEININTIAMKIYKQGLPLIACRSKSGGVHCYVFMAEPIPAGVMQRALQKWAVDIDYGGSEVFPKQEELRDNLTGNWLNLPYFDALRTQRYGMGIKESAPFKMTMKEFVNQAYDCRLTNDMLRAFLLIGHEQAPPCLQDLMIEGVDRGQRNEVLYGLTLYLRKKCPPSTFKQEALNLNQTIFSRPLNISEANRTIQSATRREYKYKCTESPFRERCDSKACLTRTYGIEPNDSFETGEGIPEITRLRVFDSEPPMWEVTMHEKAITVDTKTLRNHSYLAEVVMENLFIVMPILKQKEWLPMLSDLMKNVEHVEMPIEASITGIIRERLVEYLERAPNYVTNGKDMSDRELVLRGLPVVQETANEPGKREVWFKHTAFVQYLKNVRSEELKGNALYFAIKKMGVFKIRKRINGKPTNLLAVPIDGKGRTKVDPDYNPEVLYMPKAGTNPNIKIMNKINF